VKHGRLIPALLAFGAFLSGCAVSAPSFESIQRQARDTAFSNTLPSAGFEITGVMTETWTTVTFFRMWDGSSSYWIARKASGTGYTRTNEVETVWADSRTCPTLIDVLLSMESVSAVQPDLQGIGQDGDFSGFMMDGVAMALWSSASTSEDGIGLGRFEVRSNDNTPLETWWGGAAAMLAPCWDETKPPVDPY